ncbi:MAG: hypothetical protein KGJ11_03305, partial [Candidatus Omnitrophica bacterium]|nr:hypothetical protein [Candidatus Omnitrophota bacterium]
AGTTNQLTITAYDAYGNVAAGYTGDKSFTFTGASNFNSYIPYVTDKTGTKVDLGSATTIAFTNGVSTAGGLMTLYKVESASISATDGTLTSNSVGVTVTPAVAVRFVLTPASSSMVAGTTNQLSIVAYDLFGNVATPYTGSKTLTFSGADAIGIYTPTVTDASGTGVAVGTSTTVTFTNGVASNGGLMTLYKAQTAALSVTDGFLNSNTASVAVAAAAAVRLDLTAPVALLLPGMNEQLAITAYDPYGNVAAGYTGNKTFTFDATGMTGGIRYPTITDNAGHPIDVGTPETLTFTNGVMTAGGLLNMTKIDQINFAATDYALTSNAVSVQFFINVNPLSTGTDMMLPNPLDNLPYGPAALALPSTPASVWQEIKALEVLYDRNQEAKALPLAEDILAKSGQQDLAPADPAQWADGMVDIFYRNGELRNAILWRKRSLVYFAPEALPKRVFQLWRMMARYRELVGDKIYFQDKEVSAGQSHGRGKLLRQRVREALLFKGAWQKAMQAEVRAGYYGQLLDFHQAGQEYGKAIAALKAMRSGPQSALALEQEKQDWRLQAQSVFMQGAYARNLLLQNQITLLSHLLINP